MALKYLIIYVAHLILDSADLAPLYPILFSIPSFIREVSEGQEGESVPKSLNTKGGMAAWVTVSYGFRGSNKGLRVVSCFAYLYLHFLLP